MSPTRHRQQKQTELNPCQLWKDHKNIKIDKMKWQRNTFQVEKESKNPEDQINEEKQAIYLIKISEYSEFSFRCFPIYLSWSDVPDAMILVFWMLSFKPAFSIFSFNFIKRLFDSSSLSSRRVVSSEYLRLLTFPTAILIPACASSSLAFLFFFHFHFLSFFFHLFILVGG